MLRTAPNADRVSDLIYRLESEEGRGGWMEEVWRTTDGGGRRGKGVFTQMEKRMLAGNRLGCTHAVVIWALSLSLLIDLI